MIVTVLKESGYDLPEQFLDCLPDTCPDCGQPMEISEALTGLHCSNFRCPSKVAQRLVAIANKLGVKDLGESRAMGFVRKFRCPNPLWIFAYEPSDGEIADGVNIEISTRIYNAFADRKKFTLPEYVKIAQLPFIQESALPLFSGYSSLTDAYRAIEAGGVSYIADKLNIKGNVDEISIRALKIYDSLMTYKSDLFEGESMVEIVTLSDTVKTYNVVCSTAVGGEFKTKADFYAYCNNNFEGTHINFGSSVSSATDYLVWSGVGSPTNKVKKALSLQEKGNPIQIVNATEFINILKG